MTARDVRTDPRPGDRARGPDGGALVVYSREGGGPLDVQIGDGHHQWYIAIDTWSRGCSDHHAGRGIAPPPTRSRVRMLTVNPADWPDLGVSRVVPYAGSLGTVLLVEVDAHPPRALVLLDDLLHDSDLDPDGDGMPDLICHWLPLSALEVAP